jgi:N-acetylglucosaminyldiphosphoundecaprenol N-acetyl-beta-D-mannosaminyltransferase
MTDPSQASIPPRCNVLGIGVHAVNIPSALQAVADAVREGRKGYVCVTGVHGVMEAQKNTEMRSILNAAFLNVPDGMPMVWVGRSQGFGDMKRVYGPEFMMAVCEASVREGWSHFLYGGKPGVAESLRSFLEKRFPGIRIVGICTPPFRPLNPDEEAALADQVRKAKPDCFWVGLSTPKQEMFMSKTLAKLEARLMFGVGAAFDVWTGNIQDAPAWMKKAGLQWVHRLVQEPRRLWRRYAVIVPSFLFLILLQAFGLRKYRLDR